MGWVSCIAIVFLVLAVPRCTESAKILGVFPCAGKSVHILYNRLMKGLAEAGHHITMISPYENKISVSNGSIKTVLLTGFAEDYDKLLEEENFLDTPEQSSIWEVNGLSGLMFHMWEGTFNHPNVKKFLSSDQQFDLLITEPLFSESLLMFAHIYKCPSVHFTSMGGVNPWINDMAGTPVPPSYVPHFFFLGESPNGMQFFQRVHNSLFHMYDYIFKHYYSFPAHNQLLKANFENPPDVETLYYNVSLTLLGSHTSLRQATPFAPNVIDIGGFHIDPPKKLPQELQDFLDNAKDGVIYFSMGSHIKSSDFSDERKKIILNVFRRLKQKVLWKFENDELPGQPPNLLIKKWVPQMDILAHPNIKLFISHGGYGSTLETIYHGVPALMIPVFADQFNNANQAVQRGYALKLSYVDKNFNEEKLYGLIQEILKNPKYSDQAKLRSRLFHDRQNKPLDTAIYWIEYVIRYKGADHLKISGRTLPWYQFYLVDVMLFLTASILLFMYVLYSVLKVLIKTVSSSKTLKVKKS